MKNIVWTTTLMFALIMSLPFLQAIQISLISVEASGQDDIPNYIRPQDTLRIQANVSVDQNILATDIENRISIGSSAIRFDECIKTTETTVLCTFEDPFDARGDREFDASVRLQTTNGITQQEQRTVTVDSISPSVSSFFAQQNGSFVSITASVIDQAFVGSYNRCVGLASITARVDIAGSQGPVVTELLNQDCAQNIQFNVPLPAGLATQATVHVNVTDRFGYQGGFTNMIDLDAFPPQIRGIQLVDSQNRPLRYVGQNPQQARLIVNVTDDSSIVQARYITDQSTIVAPCSIVAQSGDQTDHVCATGFFLVSEQNLIGTVDVTDGGNNIVSQPADFFINTDNTAPVLDSITSDPDLNGTQYIGSGAPILATFNEAESGLEAQNVRLTINGQQFVASFCDQNGIQYTCGFIPTNLLTQNRVTVTAYSATDNVGNSASGQTASLQFIPDTVPPQITNLSITSLFEDIRIPFLAPIGGSIRGSFFVDDVLPITATVDTSSIGGGQNLEATCEEGFCVFTTSVSDEPVLDSVIIAVTDAAGNTETVEATVGVTRIVDGIPQAYITEVQIQPAAFDRSIGQLVNQRGYASIAFQPVNVFTRSIEFEECIDDPNINSSNRDRAFFQEIEETPGLDPTDTTRSLRFVLGNADLDVDKFELLCFYKVAYERPLGQEQGIVIEDINISVQFALGNTIEGFDDEYEEQLQGAIADATGILGDIAEFEAFLEVARNLCRLWNTVQGFLTAINTVLIGLNIIGLSTPPILGLGTKEAVQQTGASVCFAMQSTQVTFDGIGKFVSLGCAVATCRFSLSSALLDGLFDNGEFDPEFPEWSEIIDENAYGGAQEVNQGRGRTADGVDGNLQNQGIPGLEGASGTIQPGEGFSNFRRLLAPNTEDSLILSTVNLCLPGVVKNLNEMRQLMCRKVNCLVDEVPQGVPPSACHTEYSYGICKYVVGEVFNLINLLFPFDALLNMLKQIFSDPFALIGAVWALACAGLCWGWYNPADVGTAANVCATGLIVNNFGKILAIIDSFIQGDLYDLDGPEDACDEMEVLLDEAGLA